MNVEQVLKEFKKSGALLEGHFILSSGLHSDENTIVVGVWMLQIGEDLIVARRLREVLSKAIGA